MIIDYTIFLLFAVCVGAWIVMAYHSVQSIANRRQGSDWRFWFTPLVHYREKTAKRHFTEAGMVHFRRKNRAMKVFFASCGLLLLSMLAAANL